MKRIVILTMILALLIPVSALAEAETPSPANQYYTYSYTAEGYGDFNFFFHFYEEDPVLGAVFYAGLSNNQSNFAGLYTTEAIPYEYSCYADREAAMAKTEILTGAAPYTITFYDWNGNVMDICGWDGKILYVDCETIYSYGSAPVLYALDSDMKYQSAYDGEMSVSYIDFVVADDPTSTVSLCHNKTYVDMMSYYIDGSWTISYAEDGSAVYTLVPFDESEDTVTLTVATDKLTAVYTDGFGDNTEMVNAESADPKLKYIGSGKHYLEITSSDAELTLNMYDDDTCELSISAYGAVTVLDNGTYTVNPDYSFSIVFGGAGEFTASLNAETRSIVLHYINAETELGAVDSELTIVSAE